jgi:hypothetical protein
MILRTSDFYYGIDPGAKGAVACISSEGVFKLVEDLPKTDEAWLDLLQIDYTGPLSYCAIEDVHALPRQSTVAGFTFGKNVGKAELLAFNLAAAEEPLRVTPQKWKKYFGLSRNKKESIELAKELFPEASELLTASKDGRAEALLIAEYCRRYYLDIIGD